VQKAPERLVLVAELPRTASGKVQRFALRDRLRAEATPSGSVRR
jgi:acyl-coenzyme A synthetase/AMP-(fatty) acid ligase